MGTLSSVDVINQYYDLRLDIFNSSYATLCTEAIERSMDNDDISPFHYKLYTSYLKRSQMVIHSINVNYSSFKMYESFWVYIFNHSPISNSYDQSKLVAYSFVYDGTILESELYKDHMPFEYLTKRYTY